MPGAVIRTQAVRVMNYIFCMTAVGRKRKSETVDFEQFERPLLRKADVRNHEPGN